MALWEDRSIGSTDIIWRHLSRGRLRALSKTSLYSGEPVQVEYYIDQDPSQIKGSCTSLDRTHRFQPLRLMDKGILTGCRLRPFRARNTRAFVSSAVSWAN